MAGRHLVSTLLVKNLLPVTTRDALELHIEDITGAEVVDIKYTNGETEAIVKLNKTIILDGETHRTISGNDVRIVPEINITKTLNCPPAKCDLLNMLLPQLKSSHQDCSFKMVTEGIELSGASRSVNKALLDLSEQVFTFDVRAISDVQSQKAKLLWSKRGKQEIKSLFRNAGIRAALSVRNGQLWLSATDSDKVSEAAMLLEENIHMVKIPVGHLHQKFFHSDKWTQFIDDLKRKYSVSIEKGSSEIVLVALGDCYGKMKKQVDDTLKSSAQDTREIPLAEEDWNLLRTYYQEEVEALGSKSDDGTGSIQVTLATTGNGKGVIKVSGDTILLQDVKTKIMKFLERIIHQTDDYSIPGLAKHFSEGLGATIISGIQTKCNSFIRVTVGEEADDEEGDEEDVLETEEEPETTSEAGYKASKVALEVEQGDIATLKADVLVNTPSGQDMDLTKCGEIADAFCKTGGEKMQQLYDAAVGDGVDVVMTRACGNLQCTQVFHVRIDSLRRNKYSYERLEADIYKCLQKASQLQANSIVFPTVGCGGLRFDPREVVQCFKRAVKKHGSDASCCISKVIIAAYGNDVYLNFVQLVGSPNASQPVPARPQRPTRTRRTTTHNRSSQPRHSSTVFFHITALGQSHIADTLNQLEHSINEYTAKETVQVEYLEMFTGDEIEKITSLGSEEVRVFIETPQQKCFHLVGSKQAMTAIVGAVQQKVQETQGKEEFMLRNGDRSTYLNYIANRPEEIPAHWKTLNQRDETAASKVSVDSVVANAIKVVVQRTWQQHLTTKGQDAAGLSHTTIEVTDVEQIENPHLYFKYERTKKEFCALAAKGIHSFPKVTSDPDEKDDVMTSTKGIKLLDDQLIPDINEYFLFHGAPQQYIESILRQGIDFRLNSRGMFGKGAYFGESSTKADQYADDKHNRTSGPHSMFLCKVILGHSHIAKAPASDLQRPPCLHHCAGACVCGPSDFHNSVVGTHRDGGHRLLFREFVIYEQSQIYPAYLITYKRE